MHLVFMPQQILSSSHIYPIFLQKKCELRDRYGKLRVFTDINETIIFSSAKFMVLVTKFYCQQIVQREKNITKPLFHIIKYTATWRAEKYNDQSMKLHK